MQKAFKWRENHPGVCQTSFGSVSDRFSIKWNGQGSFWRPLTQCFRPKMSKSPYICIENKSAQKKVSPYKEKTTVDPSQHQREAFQTHLQLTNVVWDHSRGVSVDFRKSQILAILECGNRTFKFFPTFFKKDWRGKLFCAILAHIKTAFKQKRTKPEFSRNKSYPLNAAHFWPKCFRPQKPKISYIYIANKSCQSKKVLNDQRTTQESAKHHLEVFQADFQSREMPREPSRPLWLSVSDQKSQNRSA